MASVSETKDLVRLHSATAHDWEGEKQRARNDGIYDDGTMTFFWRAHTITTLIVFICILVYVTFTEDQVVDSVYNQRRGIFAVIFTFLLFGVIQTPDGPFKRPHPAFWRLVLCLSIVYELGLVYILFQSIDDARQMMRHFDDNLGQVLPERGYGGNCLIYDSAHQDPFHNIWDKFDGFILSHFFGWWLKTMVIRDWWLSTVCSIMFEILEYTLEHQLPNFGECWWDHWILDALLCNGLGIYMGMKTLQYLSIKEYEWRGLWNIPTYRGKIQRLALQFTPYSWTEFDWRPFSSLKRWGAMLIVVAGFSLVELNSFYLKHVLWIPTVHYMNVSRLLFWGASGAPSIREFFQYLDDPTCKTVGRQFWIVLAILLTETLVVLKGDWLIVTMPLPPHIQLLWVLITVSVILLTVWKFYIYRDVKSDIPDELQQSLKDEVFMTSSNNNNSFNVGNDISKIPRKISSPQRIKTE